MIINTVKRYIESNKLLSKSQLQLIALSGGADSVALMLLLQELGYNIEAVHCNFHLRGEESNRDETFVKQLCQHHGIELHLAHFDTRTYAELHKVSIEMAARELRYRYFEQLRQDTQAECICVAHHRNDSVETLLINLIRGTGIHGLTGIRKKNGAIARPLLCLNREQILAYLKDKNQDYVTDSTNLIDDVVRNKIRLNIIPLLEGINPSVIDNISETAEWLGETEQLYNKAVEAMISEAITPGETDAGSKMSIEKLKQSEAPHSLLFEWLRGYGFSSATIRQIYNHLSAQTGRIWSSDTHQLAIDRGYLCVAEKRKAPTPLRIPEPGNYRFNDNHMIKVSVSDTVKVSRDSNCATLDASLVNFPLIIRSVESGDSFVPYGMKGHKLVNDYLTDRKCPVLERDQQLVVIDASGQIIWLAGHRTSQLFCVSKDTTRVLSICITKTK